MSIKEKNPERTIKKNKNIRIYKSLRRIFGFSRNLPISGMIIEFIARGLRDGQKGETKYIEDMQSERVEIVAICSPDFRGVRSATKELVPNIIEVSEVQGRKKAKEVAEKILDYEPTRVLISGHAKGHDLIAEELKKNKPELRIFVLIHSAFIWFDVYPSENRTFESFLQLSKLGVVEKIGFCKRDLSEYFKTRGYNTFFVMNRFYPERHSYKKINKKNLKIGIWGSNFWHRNITNQVIAATLVPHAEIHVNEISEHGFIDMSRVTVHGFLPKKEYLKLMSEMDINLYVSITDCFPMTLVESMQFGIPAIASDTSDVYTLDKKLHDTLTVSTVDGPLGIKDKINDVVRRYDSIQDQIKLYLPKLKKKSEETIKEFLR